MRWVALRNASGPELTKTMSANAHPNTKSTDIRFQQLLQLASEGDEGAISDLWHEFTADFWALCE